MHPWDELLDWWLGPRDAAGAFEPERTRLWFSATPEVDRTIEDRFGDLHAAAAAGRLNDWADHPHGRLALVVLLDQFTRNLYRRTPRAFENDENARILVLEGLEQRVDEALVPIERLFFYMPLQHAEDPHLQARSLTLTRRLARTVHPRHLEAYEGFIDHAARHLTIIDRFGRFPHRNELLGRTSTPEEAAWLARGGPRFGQ